MFRKFALATVLTMATFGAANAADGVQFEIQNLTSSLNQAERLESQTKRKIGLGKRKLRFRKSMRRAKSSRSKQR